MNVPNSFLTVGAAAMMAGMLSTTVYAQRDDMKSSRPAAAATQPSNPAGDVRRNDTSGSAGPNIVGDNPGGDPQAVNARDRKYMEDMARANLAEVEAGKLAMRKATSEETKQFAERMVKDHAKANSELSKIAASKNVALPTEPARMHQEKKQELELLSGTEFDRTYLSEAGLKDHQMALKLFQDVGKNARDPDVKAYAQKTVADIQQHMHMANEAASGRGPQRSALNPLNR